MNRDVRMMARIRNFGSYTDTNFDNMRQELGLTLSRGQLRRIAQYYSSTLKKAPTVSEICFLNDLSDQLKRSPDKRAPLQLETYDGELYETLEDMQSKLHALSYELKRPATYSALASAADAYLERSGKEPVLPKCCSFAKITEERRIAERKRLLCEVTSNTKIYLNEQKIPDVFSNDFYACVMSNDRSMLNEFISDMLECQTVSMASPVEESGILSSLMRIADGATVNLSAVASIFTDILAKEATDYDVFSYLLKVPEPIAYTVRVTRAGASRLQKICDDKDGIDLVFIGIAGKKRELCLRRGNNSLAVKYNMEFLLSLGLAYEALKDPSVESDLGENLSMTSENVEISVLNEEYVGCEVRVSDCSSYRKAMYAVLNSVGMTVAKGYSYTDCEIFASYTLKDPHDSGADERSLSMIAGAYRAKAELAIGGSSECIFSDAKDLPTLKILSYANAKTLIPPSDLTSDECHWYLLVASKLDSGIPDFSNLRKLLRYIDKLRADGVILELSYVGGLTLFEVLSRHGASGAYLSGPEKSIAFGFLAKTLTPIKGIELNITH